MTDNNDDKNRPLPTRKANAEKPEQSGFWQSTPSDDPAGYGGGRERGEELSKNAFGETGWSASRSPESTEGEAAPPQQGEAYKRPDGVKPTEGSGPGWQEQYTRENADKYGQQGGRPSAQRGSSQSGGGFEHREQGLGSTQDVTPRGAYGQKETENWDDSSEKQDRKES